MSLPTSTQLPQPSSSDVGSWTNTDVLLWLLRTDQKLFVPAFCTNNVTGALLLQFADDSAPAGRRLADFVAGTPPSAVEGLEASLQLLLGRGTGENQDPHRGWCFSTHKVALEQVWKQETSVVRFRARRDALKRRRECVAVLTLLTSTIATIVSVLGTSVESSTSSNATACDDEEADAME